MEKEKKYTSEDLKEMQTWPLERKIQVTQTRLIEWYQHYDGKVYVSFSGGKDSTVLLDMARRIYPTSRRCLSTPAWSTRRLGSLSRRLMASLG